MNEPVVLNPFSNLISNPTSSSDINTEEINKEEKEPVVLKDTINLNPKEVLRNRINAILAEHNWNESDIPVNHEYWILGNQLRGMK